jgi:CBS domain-containing protein
MSEEDNVTVEQSMDKEVETIDLDSTARDCAKMMAKDKVDYAVIVQRDLPIGIITERDMVEVIAENLDPSKVLVRDVMSTPLITIKASATMTEAAQRMAEYKIRRLVALDDNGNLVGIVGVTDLARIHAKRKGFSDVTLNVIARLESPIGGPYQ